MLLSWQDIICRYVAVFVTLGVPLVSMGETSSATCTQLKARLAVTPTHIRMLACASARVDMLAYSQRALGVTDERLELSRLLPARSAQRVGGRVTTRGCNDWRRQSPL